MMECNCDCVNGIATIPSEISRTVTYENCLRALAYVMSTKVMVAMKNLCKIIHGLIGIKPSFDPVCNMLHSVAEKDKVNVDAFLRELNNVTVVHCDETGLSVNGKLRLVHVISTTELICYVLS